MSEENLTRLQNIAASKQKGQEDNQLAAQKVAVEETNVASAQHEEMQEGQDKVQVSSSAIRPRREGQERHYPVFEEIAETVAQEFVDQVSDLKRDSRNENALFWAKGVEIAEYVRKGKVVRALKMELEEEGVYGVPIYVFQNEAGSSYRRLENLIGNQLKVGINTLEVVEDDPDNPKYVAIGSINQAEFQLGNRLFEEFEQDKEKAEKEVRVGTVTQIIEVGNFSLISFNYEGLELGMLGRNWAYRRVGERLTSVARVGQSFKFNITSIRKADYDDIEKQDQDNPNRPKGIYFEVETTRLPFLPSPDKKVKDLYERNAQFEARIVRYHPVKGILVEIAPNWWIKGILSNNSPYHPSKRDEVEHTPVVVQIESLNEDRRNGRARILRFPKGVARTLSNVLHP